MSEQEKRLDEAVRRLSEKSGFRYFWEQDGDHYALYAYGRVYWPGGDCVRAEAYRLQKRERSMTALVAWIEERMAKP